jgi:hypothetical protein
MRRHDLPSYAHYEALRVGVSASMTMHFLLLFVSCHFITSSRLKLRATPIYRGIEKSSFTALMLIIHDYESTNKMPENSRHKLAILLILLIT